MTISNHCLWVSLVTLFLTGGCESMSQQPWLMRKPSPLYEDDEVEGGLTMVDPTSRFSWS